jgi:hypothetical protein
MHESGVDVVAKGGTSPTPNEKTHGEPDAAAQTQDAAAPAPTRFSGTPQEVDVSNSYVGADEMQQLCRFISRRGVARSLRTLCLARCKIGVRGCQALSTALLARFVLSKVCLVLKDSVLFFTARGFPI